MEVSRIGLLVMVLLLSACSGGGPQNFAPVSEPWQESLQRGVHRVRQGETLFAIAWRYEVDHRELAARNHLIAPYTLREGQQIRYLWPKTVANKMTQRLSNLTKERYCAHTKCWQWPTKGKIIRRFSPTKQQKGIDVATPLAAPVYAAAQGRVAYAGDGIPGYGNLLIIKHDDVYLSAYAHNQQLLVKEGQNVRAGQLIAKTGYLLWRVPGLHFEIRKAGKPIDPLRMLA